MKRLLGFIFKQYPAYLREKPSIRRVLLFPFLLVYLLFGKSKIKEAGEGAK